MKKNLFETVLYLTLVLPLHGTCVYSMEDLKKVEHESSKISSDDIINHTNISDNHYVKKIRNNIKDPKSIASIDNTSIPDDWNLDKIIPNKENNNYQDLKYNLLANNNRDTGNKLINDSNNVLKQDIKNNIPNKSQINTHDRIFNETEYEKEQEDINSNADFISNKVYDSTSNDVNNNDIIIEKNNKESINRNDLFQTTKNSMQVDGNEEKNNTSDVNRENTNQNQASNVTFKPAITSNTNESSNKYHSPNEVPNNTEQLQEVVDNNIMIRFSFTPGTKPQDNIDLNAINKQLDSLEQYQPNQAKANTENQSNNNINEHNQLNTTAQFMHRAEVNKDTEKNSKDNEKTNENNKKIDEDNNITFNFEIEKSDNVNLNHSVNFANHLINNKHSIVGNRETNDIRSSLQTIDKDNKPRKFSHSSAPTMKYQGTKQYTANFVNTSSSKEVEMERNYLYESIKTIMDNNDNEKEQIKKKFSKKNTNVDNGGNKSRKDSISSSLRSIENNEYAHDNRIIKHNSSVVIDASNINNILESQDMKLDNSEIEIMQYEHLSEDINNIMHARAFDNKYTKDGFREQSRKNITFNLNSINKNEQESINNEFEENNNAENSINSRFKYNKNDITKINKICQLVNSENIPNDKIHVYFESSSKQEHDINHDINHDTNNVDDENENSHERGNNDLLQDTDRKADSIHTDMNTKTNNDKVQNSTASTKTVLYKKKITTSNSCLNLNSFSNRDLHAKSAALTPNLNNNNDTYMKPMFKNNKQSVVNYNMKRNAPAVSNKRLEAINILQDNINGDKKILKNIRKVVHDIDNRIDNILNRNTQTKNTKDNDIKNNSEFGMEKEEMNNNAMEDSKGNNSLINNESTVYHKKSAQCGNTINQSNKKDLVNKTLLSDENKPSNKQLQDFNQYNDLQSEFSNLNKQTNTNYYKKPYTVDKFHNSSNIVMNTNNNSNTSMVQPINNKMFNKQLSDDEQLQMFYKKFGIKQSITDRAQKTHNTELDKLQDNLVQLVSIIFKLQNEVDARKTIALKDQARIVSVDEFLDYMMQKFNKEFKKKGTNFLNSVKNIYAKNVRDIMNNKINSYPNTELDLVTSELSRIRKDTLTCINMFYKFYSNLTNINNDQVKQEVSATNDILNWLALYLRNVNPKIYNFTTDFMEFIHKIAGNNTNNLNQLDFLVSELYKYNDKLYSIMKYYKTLLNGASSPAEIAVYNEELANVNNISQLHRDWHEQYVNYIKNTLHKSDITINLEQAFNLYRNSKNYYNQLETIMTSFRQKLDKACDEHYKISLENNNLQPIQNHYPISLPTKHILQFNLTKTINESEILREVLNLIQKLKTWNELSRDLLDNNPECTYYTISGTKIRYEIHKFQDNIDTIQKIIPDIIDLAITGDKESRSSITKSISEFSNNSISAISYICNKIGIKPETLLNNGE